MKTSRLILIVSSLALGGAACAAEPPPPPAPVAPAAPVIVPTTVSELATGYAAAVQQMSLKGLVIFYQGGKDVVAIKGIRTVRASAGVLVVTFSAGDMMALNAERVLMITDGTRTP